jgi:uncharacterized protein (DUF1800 family)
VVLIGEVAMTTRTIQPRDTSTAFRRFGLGPKPGDLARVTADPRGFVLAALANPKAALIPDTAELEPSHAMFAALKEARMDQSVVRAFGQQQAPSNMPTGEPMTPAPAVPGNVAGQVRREAFREEMAARVNWAIETQTPFLERLVQFWSNHFCVAVTKGPVRVLAGGYEREAIRPHVLGRFGDMLRAVEQHPAMLLYLDNAQSIGPNSKAGLNRAKGLNENLAREILELHTVGVAGGFTQTDVTNLARILTGWTVGQGANAAPGVIGRFQFTPNRHEPGDFQVLTKTYPQSGQAAGEAVLADLARHPETARHIAAKFARHFVSDNPPPALVNALEQSFRATDGDLAALARTLVMSPLAWDAPATKIVPPYDFTVSLVRAFGLAMPPIEVHRLASVLGQPLWQVPSPKGWPDLDDSWMGPSPIRERLRIAEKVARDVPQGLDPRAVLVDLVGGGVNELTKQAVARAETREQAFELLIMSPDLMRR